MTPEAEPRTVSKGFYTPFEHRYGAIETEPVACGWCGSASYRLLGTENGFEIRACRDCSLVYVSPQPTVAGLEGFYEDFYADRDAARSFGDVERHLRRFIQ